MPALDIYLSVVLISISAGLATMIVVSIYKLVLKQMNKEAN